jgi:hypothetical protein
MIYQGLLRRRYPEMVDMEGEKDDSIKKADAGFELIKKLLENEFQDLKDFDSKAGTIVGYVTLMTGLLVGLGTFSLLEKLTKPELFIPFFAAIISFIATIIFSLFSIKLVTYKDAPGVDFIKDSINDPDKDYDQFTKEMISAMGSAIEENKSTNKRKAKLIKISWRLLILGFLLLIIFAGIYFGTNFPKQDKGMKAINNLTLAAKLVYDMFPEIDRNTLSSIFPDMAQDNQSSFESVQAGPEFRPHIADPWIQFNGQWTHDDLNVYIMMESSNNKVADYAAEVITNWSNILKLGSHNSSAWNFHVMRVSQQNVRNLQPSDIVVTPRDEPNKNECQDSWGYSEKKNENRQYAIVYTSCGQAYASQDQIITTLYHELGHTLGLGHVFNKNTDLMCGRDEELQNRKTCFGDTDLSARPSSLDIDALLYSYGTDGFGGFNRELRNEPYYLPFVQTSSLNSSDGNKTGN